MCLPFARKSGKTIGLWNTFTDTVVWFFNYVSIVYEGFTLSVF